MRLALTSHPPSSAPPNLQRVGHRPLQRNLGSPAAGGPQALRRAGQLRHVVGAQAVGVDLVAHWERGGATHELHEMTHAGRSAAAEVVDAGRKLGGGTVGAHHVAHVGEVASRVGIARAQDDLGGPGRLGLGHLAGERADHIIVALAGARVVEGTGTDDANPKASAYWPASRSQDAPELATTTPASGASVRTASSRLTVTWTFVTSVSPGERQERATDASAARWNTGARARRPHRRAYGGRVRQVELAARWGYRAREELQQVLAGEATAAGYECRPVHLPRAASSCSRSQSTVEAIPSRRSTPASQPSIRRAFSTEGHRRWTSISR